MTLVLDQHQGNGWVFYNGDNCAVLPGIPDNSIHLTVTSIPFSSLYTYSPSSRDIGNCRSDEEFAEHFGYVARELFRVTRVGRCVSIHVMDLPLSKTRDGVVGLKDFRGLTIKVMQAAGFVWHSTVTIWKDPVVAMQRTKALGLLYKQVKKDSSRSRQGIPDYMLQFFKPLTETPEEQRFEALEWVLRELLPSYLVTFRKDGENEDPIAHTPEEYPVEYWQRVASPVWASADGVGRDGMIWHGADQKRGGINPGDTLQYRSAREDEDERHICPLQLEAIRRMVELYSAPGETVLDPFGGIGSTPFVAVSMGRKAVAVELKRSYYNQGVKNVERAEPERVGAQMSLGLE